MPPLARQRPSTISAQADSSPSSGKKRAREDSSSSGSNTNQQGSKRGGSRGYNTSSSEEAMGKDYYQILGVGYVGWVGREEDPC